MRIAAVRIEFIKRIKRICIGTLLVVLITTLRWADTTAASQEKPLISASLVEVKRRCAATPVAGTQFDRLPYEYREGVLTDISPPATVPIECSDKKGALKSCWEDLDAMPADIGLYLSLDDGSILSTSLGGGYMEIVQYAKTLTKDTRYGMCIQPYLLNNRTFWRLNQDIRLRPLDIQRE